MVSVIQPLYSLCGLQADYELCAACLRPGLHPVVGDDRGVIGFRLVWHLSPIFTVSLYNILCIHTYVRMYVPVYYDRVLCTYIRTYVHTVVECTVYCTYIVFIYVRMCMVLVCVCTCMYVCTYICMIRSTVYVHIVL